eukprot:COSAG01_NODE_55687_length_323_cov_0.924107_1_plen_54_part_10
MGAQRLVRRGTMGGRREQCLAWCWCGAYGYTVCWLYMYGAYGRAAVQHAAAADI